ncbi:MAG: HEAT repeat domain-containing protein [Phycisphaerales bacterium]|nr:HEAT repeat domain-containing protein [Phycisphaerales bacterium]
MKTNTKRTSHPHRSICTASVLTIILGAGLSLSGCASSGGRGGSSSAGGSSINSSGSNASQPGTNGAAAAAFSIDDPVAVSTLRERALTLLTTAAASGSPEQRANALEGLSVVPSRLKPMLAPALTHESAGVRTVAAMLTGKGQIKEAAVHVRPLLNDPSPFVRCAAIYALARCGESVDQTPLANVLLTAPETRQRAHAAFILGELGNPSAVGPLMSASRMSVARADAISIRLMHLQIAEALVKLGQESAMSEIRAALYAGTEQDLEAAALAAQIIGQLKDRSATGELIVLTAMNAKGEGRYPPEARLAAAASLAQLGNPRGGFIAAEYAKSPVVPQRAQAAAVFGETRLMQNLPPLVGMLDDPSTLVKISAAAGILKITDAAGENRR